jgi:cytochrome P450
LKSNLPPEEKSLDRLGDEAQLMIGAGLETTARCLGTASFHIINNLSLSSKLRKELDEAIPDPGTIPDATELEKLPYLSACIQEAIRLIYGISSRNPRVSPDKPMRYKEWEIPAGVPVSMTTVDINHDERIFPNSRSFVPERWLGNPKTEDGESLGKYNISFGRDDRSCLGVKYVSANSYLILVRANEKIAWRRQSCTSLSRLYSGGLHLSYMRLISRMLSLSMISSCRIRS